MGFFDYKGLGRVIFAIKIYGKNLWPLFKEICKGLSLGSGNFEERSSIVGKFGLGLVLGVCYLNISFGQD